MVVLITFVCVYCGSVIHAHIGKKNKIIFSINDKLFNSKDVLSELGYYVCVDCNELTDMRFRVFK